MRGLAVTALLLLLPAAAADLQLEARLDTEVVRPGLSSANVTVTVSLDCTQVLARTGAGVASAGVAVAVAHTGATGVTWSGPASVLVPASQCRDPADPGAERSAVAVVYLAGLEGGPAAGVPLASTVTASIPEVHPEAMPAESVQASFELEAAALPAIQVQVPRVIYQSDGAAIQVPMRFTNFGNVAVTLEMDARLRNATVGGTFTMPPIALDRGASVDATGVFQPPAGPWDAQLVLLDFTPVAKDGADRGPSQHVELLFRGPKVDEKSPMPVPGWLAAVLLAAAALSRRTPP